MKNGEKQHVKLADGSVMDVMFLTEYFCGSGLGSRYEPLFPDKLECSVGSGKNGNQTINLLRVTSPALFLKQAPSRSKDEVIIFPIVEIMNKNLWTKELRKMVKRKLAFSWEAQQYPIIIYYICERIVGAFTKEKELLLPKGRVLVGDLRFKLEPKKESSHSLYKDYQNLRIIGSIRFPGSSKEVKEETLLLIQNFSRATKQPCNETLYIKNLDLWRGRLEFLVIKYLNMLVDFSIGSYFSGRIRGERHTYYHCAKVKGVIEKLEESSEWISECYKMFEKLRKLSPEERESEGILKALSLIEQA